MAMMEDAIELSYELFKVDNPIIALHKHLNSLDKLVNGVRIMINRYSLTDPFYLILIEEVTALRNNTVKRINELQEKFDV